MKTPHLICLLLATCFCSVLANAQVYSWTDEEGNTHYGDKVPEQYHSQSKDITDEVQDKVNVTDTVEKQPSSSANNNSNLNATTAKSAQQSLSGSTAKDSSCAGQWSRYRAAQACFESCSEVMAGGGKNNSKCGHCEDIGKPNCSE